MSAFQRFKNHWNRFVIAIVLKFSKLHRWAFRFWKFHFFKCLQRFYAISIITQCAFDRFSILLIIWIEFISNFKTNFCLYILFTECKCYQDTKSLESQSSCEISIFAILSDLNLTLKFCTKFFWKNSRTNLCILMK